MSLNYSIGGGSMGSTALPGLTGVAVQYGRAVRQMAHAGAAHPRLISAGRYSQYIGLKARCLRTLMGKLGTSGGVLVPCADLSVTANNLTLSANSIDNILPQATSTAADDEVISVTNGLMLLRGLSWSGVGEGVEMDIGVYPVSTDGTADPMPRTQAAAPALATAEEELDLSAATWNGIALSGMENLKLSIDTAPQMKWNPGKLFPTYIRQAPATGPVMISASFTLPDRSLLRTWGPHFQGGALASLAVTFSPFAQAATRNTGAGNDVSFALAGALEVTDANDDRPSAVNCVVHGISTGGVNSPLTWTLA